MSGKDGSPFERFLLQGDSVLDRWNNSRLVKRKIPFSPEALQRTAAMAGLRSNLLQQVIYFSHDPLNIQLLLEPLPKPAGDRFPHPDDSTSERLFIQAIALLEALQELRLPQPDFKCWTLKESGTPQFGWSAPLASSFTAADIFELFRESPCLQRFGPQHAQALYRQLKTRYEFTADHCYLYWIGHFSTHILYGHPAASEKSATNIKIRIHTQNEIQKEALLNSLYQAWHSEQVLILKADLARMPLRGYFEHRLFARPPQEQSASQLLHAFRCFQEQSAFEHTVMLLDNLDSDEDQELLNCLLDSEEIGHLTIVVLGGKASLDFDLELREDPPNILTRHLTVAPAPSDCLNTAEKGILKLFATAPQPLSQSALPRLLTPEQNRLLPGLVARGCLKINRWNETIACTPEAAPKDIAPDERIAILKELLKKTDSKPIQLLYYLLTRQTDKVRLLFEHYRVYEGDSVEQLPWRKLIAEHTEYIEKEPELLQQLVDILLSRGDYKLAKSLLLKMHPEELPFRLLKLAEIARLEKDYRQLGALLKKLRRLPAALRDECFYLKFSNAEKFGHARQADGFRKRIQSDYFQHLCMIQLVDRYIYGGHFAQAETLLSRALQFFSSQKHPLEHIQIETQRAKLLREKGERIKAEQLYKDMFIFSKTRKFGLLSAQIAVDLGNLYLTQDDARRAEMWYRKADYLFVAEEHHDGRLLVQSNLIDILIWKGQWREAEALLTRVLAYDDDRRVHSALAIDYFNLAFLEWLRHNFNSSQRWLEKAGNLFSQTQNRNGLLECLLLKNKMAFLSDDALDDISCRQKQLNRDQQIFQRLLQINPADPGFSQHCQDISLIGSKQLRFDVLLLLTRRWRIKQLLPALQDLALEMSGERKNYHYYEYHYVFFELLDNASSLLPAQTELFRETLDFFTHNKRRISDPLLAIKSHLTQQESTRDIFRSAKLVSEARQWKMPEDFFKSLLQEIDKNPSIELIRLAVYEGQRRLYFFSSPPAFPELSEEIIQHSLGSPAVCDYLLADIRKIFSSQEKIFYSYAATKVIPWKMGNGRNAFLLLASSSADFQRQDFLARHRDTLAKFAALFQQYLERDHPIHQQLSFIVGQSPAILQLKDLISKVSQVDFSLLISGESGSGKELVAKAVHLLSARANKPFISVNAAAIPENLLEAELFGYKKGAFSGATESHIGLIEAADQGTLFLDEIADLPLNLQAKLLRVLQEREIRRLGETRTVKVNIRLISATNKNLQALIKKNLFREELYYRLQDLTLSLPPLRERCGDIPLLVQHFFNKYQSPALEEDQFQELIAHFLNHPFPGNVRELESKIKAFITFGQLPAMGGYPPPQEKALNLKEAKEAFEKSFLRNSLKARHWNKSQTAQRLQISRMNLFNLIKKHQLHNDDEADS